MQLLVLAQTPPPVHGQSLAVKALLAHLDAKPDWKVRHVNLQLSRDHADIGRWRPGKLLAILAASAAVWRLTFSQGRSVIYYVPAPGKRGALYRDFLLMLLCRPLSRGIILHWHAVGLGEWLEKSASAWERRLARLLLGRAKLAIVLGESLRKDAEVLRPRRCVVIPGGLADPAPGFLRPSPSGDVLNVAFVGLGSREKGLFDALEGVLLVNRTGVKCRLTAIGSFPDEEAERAFRARANECGSAIVRHLGFVTDAERRNLLSTSDALCFPTYYPHEGQPAVLIEALAFDLPIITTRWRAIPEMLPAEHVQFVEPRRPDQIATALLALRQSSPPAGKLRAYYSARYTANSHLAALAQALLTATGSTAGSASPLPMVADP